ncbi:hypothetical protein Natoc_2684 [Natronococcus occultus SP4]|uniref:Zinc-ribbon domain-containing protein n=1 Tax=Natronococcus occultus SP4 TaxID=694430 RepID=L0K1M1_9EURY|nr:hypothetical protein Natoc_2684 [Natronococcus occultus SP4]
MGVLDALRKSGGRTELYECRNCGLELADDGKECPHCGSEEIAHYVF